VMAMLPLPSRNVSIKVSAAVASSISTIPSMAGVVHHPFRLQAMSNYQPPLTVTPRILALVAEVSEQVGLLTAYRNAALTPQLRRGNRIRTIQASLAIENNTLSVEQVTALLDGKRVLGLPRDQVTDQVANLLKVLPAGVALKTSDLMHQLGLSHHATFRKSYLHPALAAGLIEMTDPDSPRSPKQQYRRVAK